MLRVLNSVSRFLERQIIGQSQTPLMPSILGANVASDIDGKTHLKAVRLKLQKEFSIAVQWPILLAVKAPPPVGWKAGFYHSEGNLGRYEINVLGTERSHHIHVRPHLKTPIFRAILAHELVHAFQTERQILAKNQALREGMARWIEYHFLKSELPSHADKLLRMKHFTFGKSVNTIVSYENTHGRSKTLQWLLEFE